MHVLSSTRVHGALLPQSKYNSDCDVDDLDGCVGGIAARAAAISALRGRFPGSTLAVDGGDHYFGGTCAGLWRDLCGPDAKHTRCRGASVTRD